MVIKRKVSILLTTYDASAKILHDKKSPKEFFTISKRCFCKYLSRVNFIRRVGLGASSTPFGKSWPVTIYSSN
jgi:hypothetical protein